MRLISARTPAGETLGVVAGEAWRAACDVLPDGPRTMADLIALGPTGLTDLAAAASATNVSSSSPASQVVLAFRDRAAGPGPAARQGRGDRSQLPRAHGRGRRRGAGGAAGVRQVAEQRRRPRRRHPLGSRPDGAGRLRGGARGRHRPDGPARDGSRRAGPRPRLHVHQRRVGPGPPVRRRAVGPRQVARHVLPDGPGRW